MNTAIAVIIIVIYDIIGLAIWSGKFPYLIAGYLTTPKEKRAEYNWATIGKFVALILWVSSVGLGIMLSQESNPAPSLYNLGLAIFLGTIFLGVIYVNISKRFRK